MKWIKICALLVLTLSVMRVGSWTAAWTLARTVAVTVRTAAVVSNVAAFTVFLLFLYFTSLPGEPVDVAAALFGLIVFTIYTAMDFVWRPWERRAH